MHPAHGQTAPMGVDDAADQWTEQLAGETSEDFMRELEKNIPIESNLRNAIKGALKSFIASEIKERWLPQDVSQAMEAILKSIRDDIVGRGVGRCEPAAVNAAWSSLAIRRAVRGAANAYPDILASAAGGAAILKNIGSMALGQLRQELESALDRYLADYRIETFAETRTVAGCKVLIRVIWIKNEGRFHFALLSDCGCRPMLDGRGGNVQLAEWSISGQGDAAWVGEAQERADAARLDSKGSLRGRPDVKRLAVKARCCANNQPTPLTDPGQHPFDLGTGTVAQTPRPQTGGGAPPRPQTGTAGTPTEDPSQVSLPSNLEGRWAKVTLPEIPEQKLCPEEAEKLLEEAQTARVNARDRFQNARRLVLLLETEIANGGTATQASNPGASQEAVDGALQGALQRAREQDSQLRDHWREAERRFDQALDKLNESAGDGMQDCPDEATRERERAGVKLGVHPGGLVSAEDRRAGIRTTKAVGDSR